jgi:hypothetical protein
MNIQQGLTYTVSGFIASCGLTVAPTYAVIARDCGEYSLSVVSEFTSNQAVSCAVMPDHGSYFGSFDAAICAYYELSEVYDIALRIDESADRRVLPRIINNVDVIECVTMDVNGTTNHTVDALDIIGVVALNRSMSLPLASGLGNFAGFLPKLSIKDILATTRVRLEQA